MEAGLTKGPDATQRPAQTPAIRGGNAAAHGQTDTSSAVDVGVRATP